MGWDSQQFPTRVSLHGHHLPVCLQRVSSSFCVVLAAYTIYLSLIALDTTDLTRAILRQLPLSTIALSSSSWPPTCTRESLVSLRARISKDLGGEEGEAKAWGGGREVGGRAGVRGK